MYQIKRFFPNDSAVNVGIVDTLEDARNHCSSRRSEKRDKNGALIWFEGFTKL